MYDIKNAESCDDGNTISGDGCSSGCKIEKDWVCKRLITPDLPNDVYIKDLRLPVFKDICQKKLKVYFYANDMGAILFPHFKLSFNKDICIDSNKFFKAYDIKPIDNQKGKENSHIKVVDSLVKNIRFESLKILELKKCRDYIIVYTLEDNYTGPVEIGLLGEDQEVPYVLAKDDFDYGKDVFKDIVGYVVYDIKKVKNIELVKKVSDYSLIFIKFSSPF